MAEITQIPKRPEIGERLTDVVLASPQSRLNLLPFAGQDDPSVIWKNMVYDSLQAFIYYRDLEEKDDQIAQALETRKDGVLSRERQLVAVSKDADDQRAVEFAQEVLAGIPNFEGVLYELLDAPGYGIAIAEIIWAMDAARVFIEAIKPRPPEWFLFNKITEQQVGPLRLRRSLHDTEGEVVPEHKFLLYTFRPRHGNRRGRPLLRRCFWPSWFKRQDLKFWLKWLEKGSGTIAVKYPGGGDSAQALKAAEDINATTAVAIPQGFEIVEPLLKAARAGSTESYRALVKDICDTAIAKIILGQTLTSQGSDQGAGSRALGEVHENVRLEKVAADAKDLMAVINDQLLYWLFVFNFPDPSIRPKWKIDLEEPADLNSRSLVDRRLQLMGLPMTAQYLRGTYSVAEPQAGEEILVSEQEKFAQMGISSGGGAAPPGEFSDALDRTVQGDADVRDGKKDMAKLEKGALEEAEGAYAALLLEAVRKAGQEL